MTVPSFTGFNFRGAAILVNLTLHLRLPGPGTRARAAAAWLLVLLAGVNVYRAATQSITADEAFTYNHFAGGDEPVRIYDANNHVLFTWMARASVAAFGLCELALRLPTVLAGWAYLAGVFLLARAMFESNWLFLVAVAALSLNPFVLDFLSAARGYGMALAFLLWAVYLLARSLDEAEPRAQRVHAAAACLALAVAANLNFVMPSAALAGAFCLMALSRWPSRRGRLVWLARHLLVPGLLLAAAILAWPLRTAERSAFYVGVEALRKTMEGAIFYSFCHATPESPGWLQKMLWDAFQRLVPATLALSGVFCAVLLVRAIRCGVRGMPRPDRHLLLACGVAFGTLALLIAARHGLGLKYPVDRTAVYWIPLFTWLCLTLMSACRERRPLYFAVTLPLAGVLMLATLQYALQFNVRFYAQWRYDAATKQIVNLIRAQQAVEQKSKVRIGATWLFEPSLNFYRQRYGLRWMERLTRDGPHGDYDYYLLHPLVGEDIELVARRGLRVLYRDGFSGAVLARPPGVLESAP